MADPAPPTDLEAELGRLLDGGAVNEAATLAIRGYGQELVGYLVTLSRDVDAGYDLFSEVCEKLWKGLGAFRRESSVKTWAYRIAWNVAQSRFRDPRRQRERLLESQDLDALVQQVRTVTKPYLKTGPKDRLAALRETLSAEEQTLLTLRIDRGLAWKDVAAVMAEDGRAPDPAALRKRFERLRARLVAEFEAPADEPAE